jgi:hypothetical protein
MSGSLSNSEQLLDFWTEKPLDRIKDKPRSDWRSGLPLTAEHIARNTIRAETITTRELTPFAFRAQLDHETILDERWNLIQEAAREAGRRIAQAEERQIAGHILDMAVDAGQDIHPGDIVTIGVDTGKVRPIEDGEHPLGVAVKRSEDGAVTVLHQGSIVAPEEGQLFVGSAGSVTVNGRRVGTVRDVRLNIARNR